MIRENAELREQIYLKLRRDILEGRLKVGERIKQEEIAERINVSRMPVREALKRLEKDGLVTTLPKKGTWVSEFKMENIIEVYVIRKYLEKLAVELSVQNFTPEEISKLIATNREFEKAVSVDNSVGMIKYNEEFHFSLYQLCGFSYLIKFIRELWNEFPRYTYTIIPKQGHRSVQEHWDIIDAVSRGSVERAGELMCNHIEEGQQSLINQINKKDKSAVFDQEL